MTHIKISEDQIDPAEVYKLLSDPGHGAQVIFLGVVRNLNHGKEVKAVSYDAHPSLAKKVFSTICDETRSKWGNDLQVALIHRTGTLRVGEISVAILVSLAHRNEAYEASRYIIEEL